MTEPAAVAFSCRQIKLLKAFVSLFRGNFFKRSCAFFLYLKPFCKKKTIKSTFKVICEHIS